jgi:hypothetical protein
VVTTVFLKTTHCKFLCCILCLSTNKNHHSSRYFWIIRFHFGFGPFQWISWGRFLIYWRYNSVSVGKLCNEVNFPYFHTRENNRLLDYYKIISISGQYGGLGMINRPIWKCPCINLYLLLILVIQKCLYLNLVCNTSDLTTVVNSVLKFMISETTSILKS